MVKDRIDIKALNMEELVGVVDLYPWYAGARLELCRRMSALGDGSWGEDRYVEAALFVRNRRAVFDIMHSGKASSITDSAVHELVDSYLRAEKVEVPRKEEKKVRRAVGGDYFSEEDYDSVRNAPEAKGIKARPDKDAPAAPVVSTCSSSSSVSVFLVSSGNSSTWYPRMPAEVEIPRMTSS